MPQARSLSWSTTGNDQQSLLKRLRRRRGLEDGRVALALILEEGIRERCLQLVRHQAGAYQLDLHVASAGATLTFERFTREGRASPGCPWGVMSLYVLVNESDISVSIGSSCSKGEALATGLGSPSGGDAGALWSSAKTRTPTAAAPANTRPRSRQGRGSSMAGKASAMRLIPSRTSSNRYASASSECLSGAVDQRESSPPWPHSWARPRRRIAPASRPSAALRPPRRRDRAQGP